jgi:hypothetical protein
LVEPISVQDFYAQCQDNNLDFSMWECMMLFNEINGESLSEPRRYHECDVHKLLIKLDKEEMWRKYEKKELERRRIVEAEEEKRRNRKHVSVQQMKGTKLAPDVDEKPADPDKALDNLVDLIDEDDDEEEKIDTRSKGKNKSPQKPKKSPQKPPKRQPAKPKPRGKQQNKDSAEVLVGNKRIDHHIDATDGGK